MLQIEIIRGLLYRCRKESFAFFCFVFVEKSRLRNGGKIFRSKSSARFILFFRLTVSMPMCFLHLISWTEIFSWETTKDVKAKSSFLHLILNNDQSVFCTWHWEKNRRKTVSVFLLETVYNFICILYLRGYASSRCALYRVCMHNLRRSVIHLFLRE